MALAVAAFLNNNYCIYVEVIFSAELLIKMCMVSKSYCGYIEMCVSLHQRMGSGFLEL